MTVYRCYEVKIGQRVLRAHHTNEIAVAVACFTAKGGGVVDLHVEWCCSLEQADRWMSILHSREPRPTIVQTLKVTEDKPPRTVLPRIDRS